MKSSTTKAWVLTMEIDLNLLYKHPGAEDIFPVERADFKRDWMDEYAHGFVYRCLPLKIANEAGWLIRCPTNFTATYTTDSGNATESVNIEFDKPDDIYKRYIISHFGRGVITLSLPFLCKTEEPWCVWVRGYPNYYKENVSFLEGIIETFWLHSTFTYNMRLVEKNKPIRFEKGEPLMFMTCIKLQELNHSTVQYKYMDDDSEMQTQYDNWNISRKEFNANPKRGPEDWQKDYFKGQRSDSNIENKHLTTIKLNVNKVSTET